MLLLYLPGSSTFQMLLDHWSAFVCEPGLLVFI